MSELVDDKVGVNFVEPEEPMGDATTCNMKKCKKDLHWNEEKSDEHTWHKMNAAEVTKNKLDYCEKEKKTKEVPVASEDNAGAGDNQALSKCGMCCNSIAKDVVIIRKTKSKLARVQKPSEWSDFART